MFKSEREALSLTRRVSEGTVQKVSQKTSFLPVVLTTQPNSDLFKTTVGNGRCFVYLANIFIFFSPCNFYVVILLFMINAYMV